MSRCDACQREDESVQLRADDRVVCDACDALTWGPRKAPTRALADAVVEAAVARVELVHPHELRDPPPCPGCGFIDCPTGGLCPDFTDLDWLEDDDGGRLDA